MPKSLVQEFQSNLVWEERIHKLQSNVNQSTSKIIVDVERNLAFEAEQHEGTQAKQQSEGL